MNIFLMMWQSCKLPKCNLLDSTSLNVVLLNSQQKCVSRVRIRTVISSFMVAHLLSSFFVPLFSRHRFLAAFSFPSYLLVPLTKQVVANLTTKAI